MGWFHRNPILRLAEQAALTGMSPPDVVGIVVQDPAFANVPDRDFTESEAVLEAHHKSGSGFEASHLCRIAFLAAYRRQEAHLAARWGFELADVLHGTRNPAVIPEVTEVLDIVASVMDKVGLPLRAGDALARLACAILLDRGPGRHDALVEASRILGEALDRLRGSGTAAECVAACNLASALDERARDFGEDLYPEVRRVAGYARTLVPEHDLQRYQILEISALVEVNDPGPDTDASFRKAVEYLEAAGPVAERLGAEAEIHLANGLVETWTCLSRLGAPDSLDGARRVVERIRGRVSVHRGSPLNLRMAWAALCTNRASFFISRYLDIPVRAATEARDISREGLAIVDRDENPSLWANLRLNEAAALQALGSLQGDLDEELAAVRIAAEVLDFVSGFPAPPDIAGRLGLLLSNAPWNVLDPTALRELWHVQDRAIGLLDERTPELRISLLLGRAGASLTVAGPESSQATRSALADLQAAESLIGRVPIPFAKRTTLGCSALRCMAFARLDRLAEATEEIRGALDLFETERGAFPDEEEVENLLRQGLAIVLRTAGRIPEAVLAIDRLRGRNLLETATATAMGGKAARDRLVRVDRDIEEGRRACVSAPDAFTAIESQSAAVRIRDEIHESYGLSVLPPVRHLAEVLTRPDAGLLYVGAQSHAWWAAAFAGTAVLSRDIGSIPGPLWRSVSQYLLEYTDSRCGDSRNVARFVQARNELGTLLRDALEPVLAWLRAQGVLDLLVLPDSPAWLFPLQDIDVTGFDSLVFTPGIGVTRMLDRRVENRITRALYVGYSPEEAPIPEIEREAERVRAAFPGAAETLTASDVTCDRIASALPKADLLVLSCHGAFDPVDPFRSRLRLAEGWVPLDRMLTAMPESALQCAFLGACDAGANWPKADARYLALDSAFLAAGARNVISAPWPIRSGSAFAVLDAFLDRVKEGKKPARALAAVASSRNTSQQGSGLRGPVAGAASSNQLARMTDFRCVGALPSIG